MTWFSDSERGLQRTHDTEEQAMHAANEAMKRGEGTAVCWEANEFYEANMRVIRHEMGTPWRGHDKDGTCCREARAGTTTDEEAAG